MSILLRKPSEPHPRLSEPWFRALAETTSTAILVFTAERYLYVNRAATELSGYSADELLAMVPWQLSHPEIQPMMRERMAARLRGEPVPGRYEIRILTRDGRDRWVELTARLLDDESGEPTGLVTAVDVTERKTAEDALRESNARLELAQRAAGILTWEWNLQSDEMVVAPHATEVLGCGVEELWKTGQDFLAAVAVEDEETIAEALRLCRQEGRDLSVELRVATPDGKLRWLNHRGRALRDEAGTPVRMIGISQDITPRKIGEERLRSIVEGTSSTTGADFLRSLVRHLASALGTRFALISECVEGDPTRVRLLALWAGDDYGELFEYDIRGTPCENVVGRTFCYYPQDAWRLFPDDAWFQQEKIESYFAVPLFDAEDRPLGHMAVMGVEPLDREVPAMSILKIFAARAGAEIERKIAEAALIWLARHDPLTGLINRREFETRLQQCLDSAHAEARQHALFYLDLDEFKVVNDTCGHLAGDEMLKQVTALLHSRLRKTDTLARLGGDEFGVLLEDAAIEDAREVGNTLRLAVKGYRFAWQERIFEIGVSIGLVPILADSLDMTQILSAADAACYVAKEGGRNRMHEYQPDDSALAERYGEMQWIHRIHKAFAEHRFCLYYQPIVPLLSRGSQPPLCEIFIRMIGEDGSIVTPGAFIPAAERYHLIATIDRWVVHAAFVALACRTLSHGDDTCFAINLSGQSLGDDAFLEFVLEEIEATGVAPARICFEITETAAVGNLAQAVQFISALKELGCRFILDDFGSGLSSFAYLKNLAVDYLKIDGSFVRDMLGSSVQRALVESIHQIGQVMGIRTIAESVENRETLELLLEIGVDYAQGYGIAMPEPLS
jgi:diguanylate cyclase (GGDEF)-like protein/PAS domain S-box-containing protein